MSVLGNIELENLDRGYIAKVFCYILVFELFLTPVRDSYLLVVFILPLRSSHDLIMYVVLSNTSAACRPCLFTVTNYLLCTALTVAYGLDLDALYYLLICKYNVVYK